MKEIHGAQETLLFMMVSNKHIMEMKMENIKSGLVVMVSIQMISSGCK